MAEHNPSEIHDYHGSCHCGTFSYTIKLPKLESVVACNCSICSKKGYLWTFPSSDDLFVVEKGDGTLKEYQFGKKNMTHMFCPNCGTSVMGKRHIDGPCTIAVNARTLEGVDVEKLKIGSYDGGALDPAYEPPATTQAPDKDGIPEYCGSCHCGKVIYKLKSETLPEVTDCNCSICSRNAYLWLYPPKENVQVQGKEHLHCYRFATKRAGHSFCTICGVSVINQLAGENVATQPVNMRVLNGVDLDGFKIKKLNMKDKDIQAKSE